MQSEHGGDEFTVLGVMKGDASAASNFARELGATYPILAEAGDVFSAWGVRGIPQSYLVDPEGRVVAEDLDEIETILDREL